MQLIHTDIVGPTEVTSLGGLSTSLPLLVTSADMCAYLVKEKSESFDKFKEFKAMVKRQSDYSIKVLRSCKGG